jgi:germination protein M
MSFGSDSGYKQKGTIVLYFANEDGTALKEYHRTVEITNNTSLARLVVESLIAGPEEEGYLPTISQQTTIQNISVKDSICYVDLSDEFYDVNNTLKNDIIVYSVVNSLSELPTISKVQFLKNGEKLEYFRGTMPFDGIFERNLNLIEQENTAEEETQEGETTQQEE